MVAGSMSGGKSHAPGVVELILAAGGAQRTDQRALVRGVGAVEPGLHAQGRRVAQAVGRRVAPCMRARRR